MPKRVPAKDRRDKALLVRVTVAELEVLESAAHLDRRTVNSYVHAIVSAHVAALRNNEFIQTDIQNRRNFDASTGVTVALDWKPVEEERDLPQVAGPDRVEK